MPRVALDAMTTERGVDIAVAGAILALREDPELIVLLVGQPNTIESAITAGAPRDRIEIHSSTEVIGMDEDPAAAFKSKKDASVSVCARLVAEGKADAAVSAGNTGASTAAATFILKRLPGIRRPGILTILPSSADSPTALLDTGAVVDARPEDLAAFGVMGSCYMQALYHIKNPRVGILSIGEEAKKGNEQVLAAHPLLKAAPINFTGNVEGRDLFNGHCDVAVCDGFVGNVALKEAEGVGKMLMARLKACFQQGSFLAKIGAKLSSTVFAELKKVLNPDEYGGNVLVGVNGIFIITHGSAGEIMIKNAIRLGASCARENLIERIRNQVNIAMGEAA